MGNSPLTTEEVYQDDLPIDSKVSKKPINIELNNDDVDRFHFSGYEVPAEIFMEICGHFTLRELTVMSRVSKMWYLVSWKYLYSLSISSEFSTQLHLVTNEKLKSMLKKCDDLKVLHLRSCKKITDIHIVYELHPNLIELDLSSCHTKHLNGLAKTLETCVDLERLDLSSCILRNSDFEKYNCPKLKQLKLRNIMETNDELDDQILLKIVNVSPGIEVLDLFNSRIFSKISFLNNLKSLKYLDLSKLNESYGLNYDIELPGSLEFLCLYKFHCVNKTKWMSSILTLCNLKSLDLSESNIISDKSNFDLKILAEGCPKLEEIKLQDVLILDVDVDQTMQKLFQNIKRVEYQSESTQHYSFRKRVKVYDTIMEE